MIQDIFHDYIQAISFKFSYEETTEMGYRSDFEAMLKGIFESINVHRFDHDSKAQKGNKPDFVVRKNDIPILYIETKDIGVSLDKTEKSEQMSRYYGYDNLILTDYVEFRFYRNGLPYGEPIKIASYNKKDRILTPIQQNYEYLARTLLDFSQSHKEPIRSGTHLSKIMAGKAQRIRDNVRQFLLNDSEKNEILIRVYESMKSLLIHDLSKDAFADMYAQTLVYGLFVARFYDKTPANFARGEARDLIPKTNPLLRQFFDHIVGPDFDKRLEYIVDELCEVFSHANVEKLMSEYLQITLKDKSHRKADTIIHFYEDFLNEYDPELRKKMGAYYTPYPVVQFIVKSVDHLLKKEFGFVRGLADTTKNPDGMHKVQILDPAVGTGTFFSTVIGEIYKKFKGQEGQWTSYVHNDLLPRIHGFELMMAPYTIAHLRLMLSFRETGFSYFTKRLGIYLTNSLEESIKQQDLFTAFGLAESIASESKEASIIKSKTPVMVVLGNPPYSGESSNAQYKGNDVYKIEPGGGKLQERNSKWLNDDYVKFIRLAESMIEKTGEGIVAMITPHGYIDNPTFRGMRWHLMKTFNEIYVLDLHGNTNKKEKSPDGTEDKNVFDIKTGVAIFFGIKKKESKTELAKVYKADLYGKRAAKFKYLDQNLINSVKWTELSPSNPGYEWVARNDKLFAEYNKGFAVNELFLISSVGVVTSRDSFVIDTDKQVLANRIQEFLRCQTPQEAKAKFNLKENQSWKIVNALKHEFDEKNIVPISYRPFDTRFIYYHDDFVERSRRSVMSNLIFQNIGLVARRQMPGERTTYFFNSSNILADGYIRSDNKGSETIFPLFIYSKDSIKTPNFQVEIINKIQNVVHCIYPEKVFDYVYAVLYSPAYRDKYKEFLKVNFPKVPYPTSRQTFETLANLGQELRQLHILQSLKVDNFVTIFPESGTDLVEKVKYTEGQVFINDLQYFGNVSEVAWNFWIGGYQPAQKWLKDRKGKTLTNSDIEHYQKMIVALIETDNVMKKIGRLI